MTTDQPLPPRPTSTEVLTRADRLAICIARMMVLRHEPHLLAPLADPPPPPPQAPTKPKRKRKVKQ